MSDNSVSRRAFMAAAAAAPAAPALVAADTSDRIRIFDPPPARIRILCTRVGNTPGFTPAEIEQLKAGGKGNVEIFQPTNQDELNRLLPDCDVIFGQLTPATLAKAAAQVDHMSGGRLDFSLGAAWAEREFRAYGLAFPPLSERYQRLEEALQIVKLLWSERRATFHGHFYRVDDAPCEPKPVQSPHPPITIGGTGLGSLRVAARHADRLNLVGSPDKCAERIQRFERICGEIGRDPAEVELSAHPTLALAPTIDAAEELAQRTARALSQDLEANRDAWVIGAPAEVVARLRAYMAVGINHFVLAFGYPFDLAQFRLLKEEVLPALS